MNPIVLFCGGLTMVAMSMDGSAWPPEGAAGMALIWIALSVSIKNAGEL